MLLRLEFTVIIITHLNTSTLLFRGVTGLFTIWPIVGPGPMIQNEPLIQNFYPMGMSLCSENETDEMTIMVYGLGMGIRYPFRFGFGSGILDFRRFWYYGLPPIRIFLHIGSDYDIFSSDSVILDLWFGYLNFGKKYQIFHCSSFFIFRNISLF